MFFGFGAQAFDGFQGLFFAAAADEPPGGFGGKEDENEERGLERLASTIGRGVWWTHREEPLEGERYTPRPLVRPVVVGIGGTSYDDGTDRPTHL